jgi:hypothetical protein
MSHNCPFIKAKFYQFFTLGKELNWGVVPGIHVPCFTPTLLGTLITRTGPPLFSVLTLYIIQLGGKDSTYQKFFSQKTMEHLNNSEVRVIHHLPEMLSQETMEHMTDEFYEFQSDSCVKTS